MHINSAWKFHLPSWGLHTCGRTYVQMLFIVFLFGTAKGRCCVSYFSTAVIKCHDQGNLYKEWIIWPSGSRQMNPWWQRWGMAARVGVENLTFWTPNSKLRKNQKGHWGFETSKPTRRKYFLQQGHTSLGSCNIDTLHLGDQVFK